MSKKHRKFGFTLVELLTAVAIISILIALLIPSLSMVRNMARETKQNAQFSTIDLALLSFKADYGDYPPSDWLAQTQNYCGSQKLAEALLGLDLLGFNPNTVWDPTQPIREQYYPANLDPTDPCDRKNLEARKGPYLEVSRANAFRLGISVPGASDGLFADPTPLEKDTYVLCDIYSIKTIVYSNGRTVKAGTPILYYKANPANKGLIPDKPPNESIYNYRNNMPFTTILKSIKSGQDHPLGNPSGTYQAFYDYITDPKITSMKQPYRPDSYILISAGADGLYGTSDDVTNF
jgi:prepilin-type N-terminal cleavage/methylation domain-containing protein